MTRHAQHQVAVYLDLLDARADRSDIATALLAGHITTAQADVLRRYTQTPGGGWWPAPKPLE